MVIVEVILFCAGIKTLIVYLGNIIKHPTESRYFTIRRSNRIYRQAFDGFEEDIQNFLEFLGPDPPPPRKKKT
jgi:hypothetical protein